MMWIQLMQTLKLLTLVVTVTLCAVSASASDQTDVRQTVERVFQQLKSKDYGSLYAVLPSSSRSRMSRDRFVNALQRAQDFYELDRIEIGTTKVAGNLAVVDT